MIEKVMLRVGCPGKPMANDSALAVSAARQLVTELAISGWNHFFRNRGADRRSEARSLITD